MANLRIPSLQHLVRNWKSKPEAISRSLVTLALNPPRFNYNPLYGAAYDLLVLKIPYDQVVEGIRRLKREAVRENLLSVLPLLRDHFDGVSPDFFQTVQKRYYPVGRGLMVPFEPPMIYGIGGQIYFPWFSFWRQNPIAKEPLSLFVTLIDEILMQDPDLETARFEILDFSCQSPKTGRSLRVIDAKDIPRLEPNRRDEMLKTFADGYFLALEKLATAPFSKNSEDDQPNMDPDQPSFFD